MTKIRSFIKKYDFPIHVFAIGRAVGFPLFRFWCTSATRIKMMLMRCSCGRVLLVDGPVKIRVEKKGSILLGNHVTLLSRYGANLVGLANPVTLVCSASGQISIGDFSGLSGAVISSCSSVKVGNHVKIGGNVRIFDHDYHSLDFEKRRGIEDKLHVKSRPVTIGNDVFIGTNAMILKGVTIGDRAIIGAGSVVSCDVPADEIWAGNPARWISKRTEDGQQDNRGERHV
jgi:acetyltransferase-like isoleucine patch superfamily enzyme